MTPFVEAISTVPEVGDNFRLVAHARLTGDILFVLQQLPPPRAHGAV